MTKGASRRRSSRASALRLPKQCLRHDQGLAAWGLSGGSRSARWCSTLAGQIPVERQDSRLSSVSASPLGKCGSLGRRRVAEVETACSVMVMASMTMRSVRSPVMSRSSGCRRPRCVARPWARTGLRLHTCPSRVPRAGRRCRRSTCGRRPVNVDGLMSGCRPSGVAYVEGSGRQVAVRCEPQQGRVPADDELRPAARVVLGEHGGDKVLVPAGPRHGPRPWRSQSATGFWHGRST
jgi:hypothetical protein